MRASFVSTLLLSLVVIVPAQATSPGCNEHVDLTQVVERCEHDTDGLRSRHNAPDDPYVYRVEIICRAGTRGGTTIGGCGTPEWCRPPDPVYRYTVYRAPRDTPDAWEPSGTVCLESPEDLNRTVTETDVRTAFKNLTWPPANLIIDPDTRTLVNTDTAFHTTRTQPVTQTITLLGVQIHIEATPTTWTWHWAQPTDNATPTDLTPTTTTTPGTPRPHPTITHTYTRTGTTHPSVDVTYTGRYQLTDGPWHTINDTHTVPGTPTTLTIHQARPRLIR